MPFCWLLRAISAISASAVWDYWVVAVHLSMAGLNLCAAPTERRRSEYNRDAQALRLLAHAYLLNGQAAPAHACVQSARKLQDPLAHSPAMCLTAIEALIQVRPCFTAA